jgi:hypothetical protein
VREGGRERTYLILGPEFFVCQVQVIFFLHQVILEGGRGRKEGGRERGRKRP